VRADLYRSLLAAVATRRALTDCLPSIAHFRPKCSPLFRPDNFAGCACCFLFLRLPALSSASPAFLSFHTCISSSPALLSPGLAHHVVPRLTNSVFRRWQLCSVHLQSSILRHVR
jgi:hypothetical protein